MGCETAGVPMLPFAIAVAVVAAAALISGLTGERTALILGAVGLGLAFAAFRGGRVSSFLRVFLVIFSVEYVATGAAYLLAKHGVWPQAYQGLAVPFQLPLTVGLFGILVYAISFIPVVRTISGLADPISRRPTPRSRCCRCSAGCASGVSPGAL